MMIRPIRYGWSVQPSDGRELARFVGPGARWRAMRYLRRAAEALKNAGYPEVHSEDEKRAVEALSNSLAPRPSF